jgi:DNA-binding winged helix-turn-helix (wHTH) protein/TolB-like protein/TPR repeat protein
LTDEDSKGVYAFGPFRLDGAERVLLREGKPVALTPKAFEVLTLLVERHGHVVEKNDLMERVWADAFVEEGNLKATVSMLRRALGDEADAARYVETVPRRGYRFVAPVIEVEEDGTEIARRARSEEEESSAGEAGETKAATEEDGAATKVRSARKNVRLLLIACAALVVVLALVGYFIRSRRAESARAGQSGEIKSIAVLPFKSLIAGSGDEYLELGLADTLITKLSSVRQITVRPTSAVRKYGGAEQDAVTAGRELNVESVLEGNFQKLNDRIRVTARLVRVSDGAPLWANQFDEKFTDIFSVEDAISQRVAGALALRLSGAEQAQLTKRYTGNSEAYQLYLEGRYFWNKRTTEDIGKAIKYFEQAAALDSHYALAYSGLADCYNMMGYWNLAPPREAFPKAKEAAIKALEIDDSLAEAHASLAYAELEFDWDTARAESGYQRAIELNPNYETAHQWYAEYFLVRGRFDDADEEAQRAQQIDPLSMPVRMFIASKTYEAERNYDRAIEQLKEMIEIDPGFVPAYRLLGTCYREKGMNDQAIEVWLKAAALEKVQPETASKLRKAFEEAGMSGYLRQEIALLEEDSKSHYVSPIFVAMDYALLDEKDQAFEWLDKAYEERSGWLLELKLDPVWDNLRADPRFASLLARVGLPNS